MTPSELLIILGMALAVYLPKAAPLVVVSERLTSRLRGWLEYVAPAVLGALVAPSILAPNGALAPPSWDQAAFVVAFLVALLTRKMVPSLAAGLVALVIVTLLRR
jgi:branched-subunit amino acid transport protein